MTDTITILLATYNGEAYISHQIDSLLNQTYRNWRLLIRDDGSVDDTPNIIKNYQKQYPHKIKIIANGEPNKGSRYNFNALLQAAKDAPYIMFCDQDDEWKKDKIEITFSRMQALEKEVQSHSPVLIFTNFQYVDNHLNIIESKKNFNINRLHSFGFPQLLAQNPVYGCTTMINRALANIIGAIPPEADFHDHWIALVASAFGTLHYLSEKTVLYRQHGNNLSGSYDNNSFKKRFRRIVMNRKHITETKSKHTMLVAFAEHYGLQLDPVKKNILASFLCFYNKKAIGCLLNSIRNGVRCQTKAQTILLYTTILFI